jgi:hypothetical protein
MFQFSRQRPVVRALAFGTVAALVYGFPTGWAQAQSAGSVALNPLPTLESSAPGTPVPAVTYRSLFTDLPQGVENTVVDWKTANASVGQFPRGHADLLLWEEAQAQKKKGPAMPCCQGATP